jgi:hypothetical protein
MIENYFSNDGNHIILNSIFYLSLEPSRLLLRPLIGLSEKPLIIDGDDCGGTHGKNERQGKLKYSVKSCCSDAFSTTDPT